MAEAREAFKIDFRYLEEIVRRLRSPRLPSAGSPRPRSGASAATEDASGTPMVEHLFTGTLTKADASDNQALAASDPKSTRVPLSATDATTPLMQTAAPHGVGLLAELPAVLEGAEVPYEINRASG
jgi:hypothetical protein